MATREPIYVALLNLIADDPRIKGQYVTVSRVWVDIQDVNPATEMPALYLSQTGESWTRPGKGVSPKRTLQCKFYGYTYAQQQDDIPARLLNNTMDVIDATLGWPGNPSNTQTLGDLVEHVYVEGEVITMDGKLTTGQNASMLIVPVTIMIP